MRLSCKFETKRIPLGYHMMIVSLIKTAIKNYDNTYFTDLFMFNEAKKNKASKNFAWSLFLKGFEKIEDEFLINDSITLSISSPDYDFIIHLYNGLLELETFKYKDFMLKKVKINMDREKTIQNEKVQFLTLSPIHIQDQMKKPLTYNDNEFINELNYIANLSLINFRGYGLNQALKFSNVNLKNRVVKQEISSFKEITGKRYHFVNGLIGQFILEGDTNDLNDIYRLGLGFKRGQGFGMLEII